MTRDDLVGHIDAYITLEQHPGWKLLCEQLMREAQSELALMRTAKTNDELVRHTLSYMALMAMPEAPKRLYVTMQRQLQSNTK